MPSRDQGVPEDPFVTLTGDSHLLKGALHAVDTFPDMRWLVVAAGWLTLLVLVAPVRG
jgi:hypothetical protein